MPVDGICACCQQRLSYSNEQHQSIQTPILCPTCALQKEVRVDNSTSPSSLVQQEKQQSNLSQLAQQQEQQLVLQHAGSLQPNSSILQHSHLGTVSVGHLEHSVGTSSHSSEQQRQLVDFSVSCVQAIVQPRHSQQEYQLLEHGQQQARVVTIFQQHSHHMQQQSSEESPSQKPNSATSGELGQGLAEGSSTITEPPGTPAAELTSISIPRIAAISSAATAATANSVSYTVGPASSWRMDTSPQQQQQQQIQQQIRAYTIRATARAVRFPPVRARCDQGVAGAPRVRSVVGPRVQVSLAQGASSQAEQVVRSSHQQLQQQIQRHLRIQASSPQRPRFVSSLRLASNERSPSKQPRQQQQTPQRQQMQLQLPDMQLDHSVQQDFQSNQTVDVQQKSDQDASSTICHAVESQKSSQQEHQQPMHPFVNSRQHSIISSAQPSSSQTIVVRAFNADKQQQHPQAATSQYQQHSQQQQQMQQRVILSQSPILSSQPQHQVLSQYTHQQRDQGVHQLRQYAQQPTQQQTPTFSAQQLQSAYQSSQAHLQSSFQAAMLKAQPTQTVDSSTSSGPLVVCADGFYASSTYAQRQEPQPVLSGDQAVLAFVKQEALDQCLQQQQEHQRNAQRVSYDSHCSTNSNQHQQSRQQTGTVQVWTTSGPNSSNHGPRNQLVSSPTLNSAASSHQQQQPINQQILQQQELPQYQVVTSAFGTQRVVPVANTTAGGSATSSQQVQQPQVYKLVYTQQPHHQSQTVSIATQQTQKMHHHILTVEPSTQSPQQAQDQPLHDIYIQAQQPQVQHLAAQPIHMIQQQQVHHVSQQSPIAIQAVSTFPGQPQSSHQTQLGNTQLLQAAQQPRPAFVVPQRQPHVVQVVLASGRNPVHLVSPPVPSTQTAPQQPLALSSQSSPSSASQKTDCANAGATQVRQLRLTSAQCSAAGSEHDSSIQSSLSEGPKVKKPRASPKNKGFRRGIQAFPRSSDIPGPSTMTVDIDETTKAKKVRVHYQQRASNQDGDSMSIFEAFCRVTTVREPGDSDSGAYALRAKEIRIGSFLLKDRLVTFSSNNLRLEVRPVDSLDEKVTVEFTRGEITKVVWAFNAATPAALFSFSPDSGIRVRRQLHMREENRNRDNDDIAPFFDPSAALERRRRVIIILSQKLTDIDSERIRNCYPGPKDCIKKEFAEKLLALTKPDCLEYETPISATVCERGAKHESSTAFSISRKCFVGSASGSLHSLRGAPTAIITPIKTGGNDTSKVFVTDNDLTLVSSSTRPSTGANASNKASLTGPTAIGATSARNGVFGGTAYGSPQSDVREVLDSCIELCRYPPEGTRGSLMIRSSDLLTLDADTFLNDTIIDFYLSYLQNTELPKDIAEKVFIFNTFFYSTLNKSQNKNSTLEERRLSLPKRRHLNVKRWTKGVDLFSKDFIVIPICQNSHWFLVIVCYPWLVPKARGISLNPGETAHDVGKEESPMEEDDLASTSGSVLSSEGVKIRFEESANLDDVSDRIQARDEKPLKNLSSSTSSVNTAGDRLTQQASRNSFVQTASPGGNLGQADAARKTPPRAAMYIFDSLRGSVTGEKIYKTVREYLTEEFLEKKKASCVFDYNTMRGYYPHCPQQANFHDCGIFLLEYAKRFLLKPLTLDEAACLQVFKDLFDPNVIMAKRRGEIANIILKLHEEQYPNSKFRQDYEKYRSRFSLTGTGCNDFGSSQHASVGGNGSSAFACHVPSSESTEPVPPESRLLVVTGNNPPSTSALSGPAGLRAK